MTDAFNVPQLETPQLRDQSTPAAAESLPTIAVKEVNRAAPLVFVTYTLDGNTFTVTGGGRAAIVSVALADLAVSVSEVAVIVTVPPVGATEGAVYVVPFCSVPGGVDGGLNEPQTLDPQAAVQTTPAFNGSLVTAAETTNGTLICREAGTAVVIATPIGDATIVRLTLLFCEGLLVTVAVTVMAPLIGATDGAV